MAMRVVDGLLPDACQHCDADLSGQSDLSWQRSPQGRPYCPECGRIPSDHQRSYDEVVVADV